MKLETIASYVIHPIIFGVIATLSFFIISPEFIPQSLKFQIIFIVFVSTYIIPVFFLFLLKTFNTIDSFHLVGVKERRFPVFFFIILDGLLSFRLYEIPKLEILSIFFLASTISLFIVYIFLYFNIKISLHTLALGLYTAFIAIISYHFKIRLIYLISFLIFLSGLIAVARIKLKAHSTFEVYFGYLLGLGIEILSYYYVFQ